MDRNELKVQALTEGFSSKLTSTVAEYENRVADLRIEITELAQSLSEAEQRLIDKDREIARLQEVINTPRETDVLEEEDS